MALEAIFMQRMEGEERLDAYANQKLLNPETKYSTIESEWLASKGSIDLFRFYLFGRKFVLIPDMRPP